MRGEILSEQASGYEDANFLLSDKTPTYFGSSIIESYLEDLPHNRRGELIIKDGIFSENRAGYKGTACFIQDIPNIYILNTTFTSNKPVLWAFREQDTYYSAYIKPILDKGENIVYYPGGFNIHEFVLMEKYFPEHRSKYMNIYIYIYYIYIYYSAEVYIPGVKGALCVLTSIVSRESKLEIEGSFFDSNYGQPIFLAPYDIEMASSIYVQDIQRLV